MLFAPDRQLLMIESVNPFGQKPNRVAPAFPSQTRNPAIIPPKACLFCTTLHPHLVRQIELFRKMNDTRCVRDSPNTQNHVICVD